MGSGWGSWWRGVAVVGRGRALPAIAGAGAELHEVLHVGVGGAGDEAHLHAWSVVRTHERACVCARRWRSSALQEGVTHLHVHLCVPDSVACM